MTDQDFNFDFDSGSRSARKQPNSSRRRRDLNDDDLESTLGSTIVATNRPQPQPRRGSRTKDNFNSNDNDQDNDEATDPFSSRASSSKNTFGGWNEDKEPTKSKPLSSSRRRSPQFGRTDSLNESIDKENPPKENGQETKKLNTREIDDCEELDIPEIPDMEETAEQDAVTNNIAEAPDIQVHEISTYKELDKEFFKEKAFQFLEGNIDVSLLHCGLGTEQQIAEEEDVIWEWTKLFTEVVSVISDNIREDQEEELDKKLQKQQQLLNSDVFKDFDSTMKSSRGTGNKLDSARRSQSSRVEKDVLFE